MPFSLFKRSKKVSIPDPNEAVSRAGKRTPFQRIRARAYVAQARVAAQVYLASILHRVC